MRSTYIEGAMAVVDMDLPLVVAEEDDLAVGGPLDVGQLHPPEILPPDTIPIHRAKNHGTWHRDRHTVSIRTQY